MYGTCINCHDIHLDNAHAMSCTACHGGDARKKKAGESHGALIASPSHPENIEKRCGTCHNEQVQSVQKSSHYTLARMVNAVRGAFGATERLESFLAVPQSPIPANVVELTNDLLRRRCLRCHLFNNGDDYPATIHGRGCAACHLPVSPDSSPNHDFRSPPADNTCLSCHYGNYAGSDYYGRFEHDFNEEYRTPYFLTRDNRPYGVEYRQLSPDIHQQRGMACIDCHTGDELMGRGGPQITCSSCHDRKLLATRLPAGVQSQNGRYTFTSAATGKTHTLPLTSHPAHIQAGDTVLCQVCHAQWGFNDTTTHLLRSDLDDYDHLDRLTVQGSSEVEKLLKHNLDFDNVELPPETMDKITGEMLPGVWYKGYTMRRWEQVLLGRDEYGRIAVVRPILDLTLSWIDDDETIRYDSIRPLLPEDGLRPYTPHTTGPAGIFYEQRIRDFKKSELAAKTNGHRP